MIKDFLNEFTDLDDEGFRLNEQYFSFSLRQLPAIYRDVFGVFHLATRGKTGVVYTPCEFGFCGENLYLAVNCIPGYLNGVRGLYHLGHDSRILNRLLAKELLK